MQSYKLLLEKFPLPSISTLHRIQTGGVDSLKAAKKLREKGHISSDVILMVDEMFLQKEASYQSGDYVGEDEEGELYKGIACFMIVGLKQSVPHVIQAIPEVTITGEWLAEKISASLHSLAQTGFTVRGIVTLTTSKQAPLILRGRTLLSRSRNAKEPNNWFSFIAVLCFCYPELVKCLVTLFVSSLL